jgi:hypothetical protein
MDGMAGKRSPRRTLGRWTWVLALSLLLIGASVVPIVWVRLREAAVLNKLLDDSLSDGDRVLARWQGWGNHYGVSRQYALRIEMFVATDDAAGLADRLTRKAAPLGSSLTVWVETVGDTPESIQARDYFIPESLVWVRLEQSRDPYALESLTASVQDNSLARRSAFSRRHLMSASSSPPEVPASTERCRSYGGTSRRPDRGAGTTTRWGDGWRG